MVNLKYVSVNINEVKENGFRLEASVFNINARNAKETLRKCRFPIVNICGENGLATAYHRSRFKRIFVEYSQYPIFQPSQIAELRPQPEQYISDGTKIDLDSLRVKKNQILMTCSGSIGKCSIVGRKLVNQIFSHDLLRITSKNLNDTGYIYAYLITELGQNLINTNNYGAVIQHIEPEHLEKVPIPNPPDEIKQEIHELVMKSFDLRDTYNDLIDKAEQILKEELKLPPLHELKPKYFEKVRQYSKGIDSKDIKAFSVPFEFLDNRFDASYHLPIVNEIIDILLDNAEVIKSLDEISKKINMPGIFKRNYVSKDSGVGFLGTNDILQLSPKVEKYLSTSTHSKLIDKQLRANENTLLITDRGTIGNIVLIPSYYKTQNWVVSQNAIRVVMDNAILGYVFTFLNSEYGQILIKRETYGSVIDMIDPENASKIPIPLLKNKDKQKEINDLVLQANKIRTEAFEKEQEAIRLVNEKVIYTSS